MNRIYFLALVLSLVAFNAIGPVEPLSWLTGVWEMKKPNGTSRLEVWEQKDDKLLYGMGLRVTSKDTVELETMEITFKDDYLWYIPTVRDQNNARPVPFKLIYSEEMTFVFENRAHDFPQRIIYILKPATHALKYKSAAGDSLFVTLEADGMNSFGFQFRRK